MTPFATYEKKLKHLTKQSDKNFQQALQRWDEHVKKLWQLSQK